MGAIKEEPTSEHMEGVLDHYKHGRDQMTNWVEEIAVELSRQRLHEDEKVVIKRFLKMAAGQEEKRTWFLALNLFDLLADLYQARSPV